MSEWISVKDRLPGNSLDVLVYEPGEGCCVAFHNGREWRAFTQTLEARTLDGGYACVSLSCPERITHWMPLPEPPND